jgi:hypothetical protein
MGQPKLFHGFIGVKLPADINLRLRAASLETGKSLSDLIRETLTPMWGKASRAQCSSNKHSVEG